MGDCRGIGSAVQCEWSVTAENEKARPEERAHCIRATVKAITSTTVCTVRDIGDSYLRPFRPAHPYSGKRAGDDHNGSGSTGRVRTGFRTPLHLQR